MAGRRRDFWGAAGAFPGASIGNVSADSLPACGAIFPPPPFLFFFPFSFSQNILNAFPSFSIQESSLAFHPAETPLQLSSCKLRRFREAPVPLDFRKYDGFFFFSFSVSLAPWPGCRCARQSRGVGSVPMAWRGSSPLRWSHCRAQQQNFLSSAVECDFKLSVSDSRGRVAYFAATVFTLIF